MDFYEDLPNDDASALVFLEQQYREALHKALDGIDSGDAVVAYQREYMHKVLAAAAALEINYFDDYRTGSSSAAWWDRFQAFELDLSGYIETVKSGIVVG
jgi:hypothetical protein